MTFQELVQSLPNGFHDAELSHFEMDYISRRLAFDLMMWIGDMENTSKRELYRPARVTFEQVAYLTIDPLDTRYDWLGPGAIVVDAGEGHLPQTTSSLPDPPPGTSAIWFYLNTTNSFLYMAAGEVALKWVGPAENRV